MKLLWTPFLILFTCSFLNCYAQKIKANPIPDNPTTWRFNAKIIDVDRLLKVHKTDFFVRIPLYEFRPYKKSDWPDNIEKALQGTDLSHDYWIVFEHESSAIYSKKGKPLPYRMECVAHIKAIDSAITQVNIRVFESQVRVRYELLPSPPHFVNNPVYKKVKPTTIEEYKILLYIGRTLGLSNDMPALKL